MKEATNRPAAGVRSAGAGVTLLWCLVGLLVPRAALYGQLAPFGVGLAAAVDKPVLPVLLSLAVGYLTGNGLTPMRYVAALAAVGGIRWVLAAVPEWRQRAFVPPLTAFAAIAATGVALYSAMGLDGYRVLLLVAESGVAAGCAVFFRGAVGVSRRVGQPSVGLTPWEQTALVVTAAVLLMAASTVTVGGFSFGRMLAALLVLVLARAGHEQGGSVAGVVIGAATALAQPGLLSVALALAFGGLLAGVFARFGRLAQTAAFLVAAGVLTLTNVDEAVLVYLYELFAAGVVFLVLPARLDRFLHRLVLRGREAPAVEGVRRAVTMRLDVAARTMQEVAATVGVVTDRLTQHGEQDAAAAVRYACREVCAACPLYGMCWDKLAPAANGAVESLVAQLRREGQAAAGQLGSFFTENCRQTKRLAAAINRRYEQFVAQESAWRRLGEIQHSLDDQFSGMAALLQSLAAEMRDPQQVDVDLSARVAAVCADHGMPVRQALCMRGHNNRLTVDVLAADTGVRLREGRWLRDMQAACGCVLAVPTVVPCGEDVRVTLCEPSKYAVEIGVAQRCCRGEKLCGDAVDFFTLDGRTVVLLSDGMGSGGRAAVDGAMAVGLASQLWQAGFSPDSILHSVNAALLVKSREESLATLDVAVIDTFSGRLDSFKAGAASTLLCSGGRVSRIEGVSLPIGILHDIRFEHNADWLRDGDVLLLYSDGALSDGAAALERLLADRPAAEGMQAFAERVVQAAVQAQDAHPDDVTVIAVRITIQRH